MFKHAMEFLKQCPSLNKPLLEHCFISFLKDLLTKNLFIHYELLVIEITKPPRWLYATPSKWASYVSQYERNKLL
jgi:hypothetical protein